MKGECPDVRHIQGKREKRAAIREYNDLMLAPLRVLIELLIEKFEPTARIEPNNLFLKLLVTCSPDFAARIAALPGVQKMDEKQTTDMVD